METWWRHQMETFSAFLAICAGNSQVPANSPHKGQWRGALMFVFICVWINDWVNNREVGDLRRYRAHYDVIVMMLQETTEWINKSLLNAFWMVFLCGIKEIDVGNILGWIEYITTCLILITSLLSIISNSLHLISEDNTINALRIQLYHVYVLCNLT